MHFFFLNLTTCIFVRVFSFGAAMSYDVSNSVYDAFPTIVMVTLAVVFVLMAVAFNSLVAPIRSVLTLALTLSFVYGLAVLVYQHGAFSFLNLRCVF
jgi:putative drug exporter of the RND superfamily